MPQMPRLSLCIPTVDRSWVLRSALEAAVREMRSMPEGTVEILVSDNGSSDDTAAVLDGLAKEFPFRRTRHPENVGFDRNFLHCVQEARGEWVWVLGDDDPVRPGAVQRICQAMAQGADVCLFGAQECSRDLSPLEVRTWFKKPYPETDWFIDSPQAMGAHLDRCSYMAGVFGFVSVMVFRRDRFLAGRSQFEPGIGSGWIHVWGMQQYLKAPTRIHWIPEPLINNRLGNDRTEAFARVMHDLEGWIAIADAFHGQDPVLRRKFLAVVMRNMDRRHVTILRRHSAGSPERWVHARRRLLQVGYEPCLINAQDFADRMAFGPFRPSPMLSPEGICLCSLPLLVRGAERFAVLALGAPEDLPHLERILSALGNEVGAGQIRLVCRPEWAASLPGSQVQAVDPGRLLEELDYFQAQAAGLKGFAPQVLVNADPARGLAGDRLAGAVQALGSLAFRAPGGGLVDPRVRARLDRTYALLLDPEPAWSGAVCAALGLPGGEVLSAPGNRAERQPDPVPAATEARRAPHPGPRLSLCIPTRAGLTSSLKVALASAMQEAGSAPAGTVEVLVSDNGSPEPTKALLREFQAQYPWLRVTGFPEDRGRVAGYLDCLREARGEFAWILGDNEMFLSGSVARALAEFEAGADALLACAAEFDAKMNPLPFRTWFIDPAPYSEWVLRDGQDSLAWLARLSYTAGSFWFTGMSVFRREPFLASLPSSLPEMPVEYVHFLGLVKFLESPCRVHWVPRTLILNRLGENAHGARDPWRRFKQDQKGWDWIARTCSPEPSERGDTIMELYRNGSLRTIRFMAGETNARWHEARWRFADAGFDPVLVNAMDLAYRTIRMEIPAPAALEREGACLANLPVVCRGAQRILVMAELGLAEFLEATPVLEALRTCGRKPAIRVVCPEGLAPLLGGFDLQFVDRDRYLVDDDYMEAQNEAIRAVAPDLVINLSRERRILGDLLAAAAGAAGAVGFDDETPENRQDDGRAQRRRPYRRLVPRDATMEALAGALGLQVGPARLRPDQLSREQAQGVLAATGWDPARTVCILGDDPEAIRGLPAQDQARLAGWTAIGLGGPGTESMLAQALDPLGPRAVNLGGRLPLGAMAAVLQMCGAFLGGSPTFQALAGAVGCRPMGPVR